MTASLLRSRAPRPVTAALMLPLLVLLLVAGLPSRAHADTTLATDGFDRSGSGWGAAPTGGTWALVGGTSSSTGGSAVTVSAVKAGRSFRASLPVTASDVTVRGSFVVPATKELYYSAEARLQADGSAYRGRLRVDGSRRLSVQVLRVTGGSERVLKDVSLGQTVSVGQELSVELLVSGSSSVTAKAKAYVTGATVPDWQNSLSDSDSARITAAGKVGVHAYNGDSVATNIATTAFSASSTSSMSSPATPEQPTVSGSHGSVAVGKASYAVPSGAVFVATTGNDANAGTLAAPVRTVTKALAKVQAGGAVVIRGGTYHEYFIVPPGKNVPIQNYPNEAVWFDGSSSVTGFRSSGSAWVVDGWTTQFDASPTYTKGQADGTAAGWQFVNPSYPLAAHPDAVWIDNVEQTQVGSVSALRAGTFYVDYAAKRLYLGSDPTGKTVEASTLSQAVSLRAPGTVLRGIGFRRFADSVWMQGVITAYYPSMTLENVVVADSATAGIGIYKPGTTLRNVTISGSGQMGLQASKADGLVVDNVSIVNSNDENFNPTPSAGGFKVTTTRGVTLRNSEIRNTVGNQFWTDQSCYDITVTGNTISNGARWGVVLEISSVATVADNVIAGNAHDGILVTGTDKVNIWNNTIVGNKRAAIALTQDSRRIEQLSVSGHDDRRAQPDLSMPWVIRQTSIGDNIMTGGSTDGVDPILRAQSWERVFSGADLVSFSNGNVFSQSATGSPKYVTIWGRKSNWAANYATLAEYQGATGYDRASASLLGTNPVTSAYGPSSAVAALTATTAQPLPAGIAAKVGQASGAKHLGAWR